MQLIDSHAHLADERLHPDADAVVERARAAGVVAIITVATDEDDADAVIELAEHYTDVYATAGIHPHGAAHADAEALDRLRQRARHPQVVALGETGLDYHYDHSPREQQRTVFTAHLEIARETDLPVIVHARDADDDLVAILRSHGVGTRGVLHSFSSGEALLDTALEIGWYISFSGMITFKKFERMETVRRVPEDRILVETDSPYLAPVPNRGRTNEPAFVAWVARRAAEIRGVDAADFAARTVANTRTLFALP